MIKKILSSMILLMVLHAGLRAEAPTWSVNSSQFEFSMSATSVVVVNETEATHEGDYLAAFVNDECRGVCSPIYSDAYDRYFFFLSVFGNTFSGETVTFKYYDAANDQVMDLWNQVTFEGGKHLGDVQQPFMISDTAQQQQAGITFSVKDENDTEITDAVVTFNGTTSETGNYYFSVSTPGSYNYQVEKQGYIPFSGEVTIGEELEDQNVEVVLQQDNTGWQEAERTSISIYPNPADRFMVFEAGEGLEIDQIIIYDVCGKQVWQSEGSIFSTGKIDVEELPSGVYFVTFGATDNTRHLFKFVRE